MRSDLSRAPESGLRFGDVWFHGWAGDEVVGRTADVSGSGARLDTVEAPDARSRLHLVVQKGRLFQKEYPEVPVLLDKGRYLVVDLDPSKAQVCGRGHAPCFAVHPLPQHGVVFETLARDGATPSAPAWAMAIVQQLDHAAFEADLVRLVAFPTRVSSSAHYAAAAKNLHDELAQLGYASRLEKIAVDGATSFNVIADRKGQGAEPRRVVIVSAHLDSVNSTGGPLAAAPGADDDGSGCAGVMTMARAFRGHRAVHDLRMILFGGEEQGLYGSRQYVAELSEVERKRIVAVVHMDMIGARNAPKRSVLLEGAAVSASVVDGLSRSAAAYAPGLEIEKSLKPFNSDHVSFLDEGIPAVLTIEGTDSANERIHTERDTIDHVDPEFAMDIIRMNAGFVAEIIGAA